MPQNPYFPPHIGPAPPPKVKPSFIGPTHPPRIGPDPTASGPLGDETAIDRASLDALKRLIPPVPPSWDAGEGGSTLGSPYDLSSARNAAGVTSQAGGDVNLSHEITPSPAVTSDPAMNQRADDINAKANSDYFNDALNYPKSQTGQSSVGNSAVQGLQSAGGMGIKSSIPGGVRQEPQEALNTFTGGASANTPLALQKSRLSVQDELKNRNANVGGSDPRTKAFLDIINQDLAEDPFTGEAAQAKTTGIEKAGLQANLGGFRTPQEASEAARQAETYKVEAPERAARIAGQADIEKQRIASGGLLDIAKEQGQGATNFLEMMRQMQASGGDIRGVTLPKGQGSLSFAPERQVPTALLRDVANSRRTLEAAKAAEHWYTPGSSAAIKTARKQLQADIDVALSQHPAGSTIRTIVQELNMHPEFANLTASQLASQGVLTGEDGSPATPDELDLIDSLLLLTRGQ